MSLLSWSQLEDTVCATDVEGAQADMVLFYGAHKPKMLGTTEQQNYPG